MARRRAQPRQLVITAGPWRIAPIALPVRQWLDSGVSASGISSNVVELSYDKSSFKLYVTFRGYKTNPSVTYAYFGVPEQVARDMYHSNSLGLFVQRRLTPYFYYQVV